MLYTPPHDAVVQELVMRCPQCSGWMGTLRIASAMESDVRQCSQCYTSMACIDGIWRALPGERSLHFARFVTDYEFIRTAEGRGSMTSDYYLALPHKDLSGNNAAQWAIRARTFRAITQYVLPPLATRRARPLRILDLGSGNGWMSYRLALLGHTGVAVDLLTNTQDGLGAAVHYKKRLTNIFPRFQAELDSLPFADASFDVAIFNASFHYSENYERTLGEAIRCTNSGGLVVIADTPWYAEEQAGIAMVEQKHADFTARYGFPSNSISNLEYLTDARLQGLSRHFDIRWKIHTPYYGMRWAMRPLLAHWHGKRTPSRFRIYSAEVKAQVQP